MALCEISATVTWALLAYMTVLTRRSPVLRFNYPHVKFAHCPHNSLSTACEIQPFFTTLPTKFISFSLHLSLFSNFHFIFAWVVLARPVQLALTAGRAQAAASLLS